VGEEGVEAGGEGGEFLREEVFGEGGGDAREAVGEGTESRLEVRGDRLPGEVPDDGAELVLVVEGESVVDGEEAAGAFLEEEVSALAVGVVDEEVEEGDGAQEEALGGFEVEVVAVWVVVDVLLEGAGSVGSVAEDGEGDESETQGVTEAAGGDLTGGEGGGGEVPQGLLAAHGLVDGGEGCAFMGDGDEEGVVGAEQELSLEGDLSVEEGCGEGGGGEGRGHG
jgi:hypothetical protein